MLKEVNEDVFRHIFPADPHPFVSKSFIDLNSTKVDRIVWLVDPAEKPEMGLVAGIKDNIMLSPFSAPFGGFHYKKENMYTDVIDAFMAFLKEYLNNNQIREFKITLPPDIYGQTFNAKCISSLFRSGFQNSVPEVTSWIDMTLYNGTYKMKNSREYYRQAERNGLSFSQTFDPGEMKIAFEIIRDNRARFGRPIYMTFDDILNTGKFWPVDFFVVKTPENQIVSSAIFYRFHAEICFAVFWGDDDLGRPLRAMDYMILHLWSHYQKAGFRFIDLGISTEESIPNSGLLRFKETHEAVSSLRFRFSYQTHC